MTKVDEPSGGVLFEEKQNFPRWLLAIMISPVLITLGVTIAVSYSAPAERREMWIVMGIIIPLQVVMFYLFYTVKLEKLVTTNGLYYRWTPLQKKYRVIEKGEIETMELRRSPSLKYGSNRIPGYGRAHNVSNGDGIQLSLTTGKKLFFGTDDKLSFRNAMEQLHSANRKTNLREF